MQPKTAKPPALAVGSFTYMVAVLGDEAAKRRQGQS